MISKRKSFLILKKLFGEINQKNINKSLDTFNKSLQDFGDSMDKLTKELNESPKNNIKIWSDKSENDSQNSRDAINLEKIWGKKNV